MSDTKKVYLHDREWDYYKDQLTGLDNRHALLEYLKTTNRLTLFMINIDNFANFNMLYGFLAGDVILKEVAQHLQALKEDEMELFRFDGDQFVFVTTRFMNYREIEDFSKSLISFFNTIDIEVDEVQGISTKVYISIGVVMGNGIAMLSHAQLAVEESRLNAKGSYKLFTATSNYYQKQQKLMYWINKIKESVEEDKLVSYFQPIMNLHTGKIQKFECLARINDESLTVSPHTFMEAAHMTGSLQLITRTIISKAYEHFADNDYEFSINITANDIKLGYLDQFLDFNTNKFNVEPRRVTLELLEDIKTLTEENMLEQINALRAKGFQIALDDFGVENSNYSRLIELKPDYLKIDGVFIKDILNSEDHQIIVRSIIDFCKAIDVQVVAEFVSSEAILELLKEMGVDFVQGYYIGEPVAESSSSLG